MFVQQAPDAELQLRTASADARDRDAAVAPDHPPGHFRQAACHGQAVTELTGRPVVAQFFGGESKLTRGDPEERLEEEDRLQNVHRRQPDGVAAQMVRDFVAQ